MCFKVGRLHTDFESIHPDIQGCKVASPAGIQKFGVFAWVGVGCILILEASIQISKVARLCHLPADNNLGYVLGWG